VEVEVDALAADEVLACSVARMGTLVPEPRPALGRLVASASGVLGIHVAVAQAEVGSND